MRNGVFVPNESLEQVLAVLLQEVAEVVLSGGVSQTLSPSNRQLLFCELQPP